MSPTPHTTARSTFVARRSAGTDVPPNPASHEASRVDFPRGLCWCLTLCNLVPGQDDPGLTLLQRMQDEWPTFYQYAGGGHDVTFVGYYGAPPWVAIKYGDIRNSLTLLIKPRKKALGYRTAINSHKYGAGTSFATTYHRYLRKCGVTNREYSDSRAQYVFDLPCLLRANLCMQNGTLRPTLRTMSTTCWVAGISNTSLRITSMGIQSARFSAESASE